MDVNDRAMNEIIESIDFLIEQKLANASFDKTKIARVLKVNDDNTYDLMLDGIEMSKVKSKGGVCGVNEVVDVKIPQNNYSKMYIIKY